MSDIRFSGIVEEDMGDLDEEVFVHAGDRVYGNLNYYGKTPYILGDIQDVDPEYVAPEFWVPVLPESIEAEIFGVKIPFARLRELASAEREGRLVVLPKVGDKLYYAPYPKGAKDCRGELFFLRNCGDGSGIVKGVSVTVKFDNWSGGVPIKKTWKTLEEAEAERALTSSTNQVDRCTTCDNNGKPICSSCIMTGHGNDIDFYKAATEPKGEATT